MRCSCSEKYSLGHKSSILQRLPHDCQPSSRWLFRTMMTCCQKSKMFYNLPSPEKSYSSLSLNPIWTSVTVSGRMHVPSTPVQAPSVWGPSSLGCREHKVSNPSSFLSPVFPHFTWIPTWVFTKPHFWPMHGEFQKDMKEDMLVCVAIETSVWFRLGLWGSTGTGGGIGVVLRFTPNSSDMEKHFQRDIKKCLPLTLPRNGPPWYGLWHVDTPRVPRLPPAVLPLQEGKEVAWVLHCSPGVRGELEQGGTSPSFSLWCL